MQSALQYLLHACRVSDTQPRPELREFGLYTLPNVRMQNYLDTGLSGDPAG